MGKASYDSKAYSRELLCAHFVFTLFNIPNLFLTCNMSKILLFPDSEVEFNVALSLSLVLFGFDGKNIEVLIAKSNNPDFKGQLFLPSRNLQAQ
tara:strand:+ start:340 stop:621 length:282 start_codon:yes stop_codon:yes gene_type:complete